MSELAKVAVSSFCAFVISFLTYHYQFRKNNRFIFRNRVRHLVHRVNEANKIIQAEDEYVVDLISKLEADSLQMHQLGTTGYDAIQLLHDKIIEEEYFDAFNYVFRRAIDSKMHFETLQYASVLLNTQLKMLKEMAVKALEADHQRRLNYVDLWHQSERLMATFAQSQAIRDNVPQEQRDYFLGLTVAANEYFGRLNAEEIKPEIRSIQQFFIVPVRAFFKGPIIIPELIQYSALLDDINYVYQDISFQNNSMLRKLKEVRSKMSPVIAKLGTVKDVLHNVQLRNLYQ